MSRDIETLVRFGMDDEAREYFKVQDDDPARWPADFVRHMTPSEEQ